MRLRISSGRLASARRSPLQSRVHPESSVSRRQVTARVASIFVTPGSDSMDCADLQTAAQHNNPFEYPPGYSLFKVKRAKKPDVDANAPVEDIREQEFLSSHKTGTDHISIYTSELSESIDFYTKGLGFRISQWRPSSLPYNGAWVTVPSAGGGEKAMIHLIELPNPDDFSTCHDESCIVHFSIAIPPGTLKDFYERMDTNGYRYYKSVNNREAAVFCDPNGYRMEVVEVPETPVLPAKRAK